MATSPRTFVIGDIHGCSMALDNLISSCDPKEADTLVFLGDYVDRGPDSAGVINSILQLIKRCHVIPLLGNHDWMLMASEQDKSIMDFWIQHGGAETLESYGGSHRRIPASHLAFFRHCQRFHETDDYFFVHANYQAELPLREVDDETLLWQHTVKRFPAPHVNGKTAIVGHTPQLDGLPKDHGHIKLLDTFCYGGQWLTALELQQGQVYQANNTGDSREFPLSGSDDPI
ncbi:MAG: serine/threonine protein phosphatase [Pirellulaceae bacterium]|nr:serine/threonine protein phosphatase [Pirellulaceae bacterium]MEC8389468.1 metallophosphoesterase family protein [Planctomycetota bacterium]